MHYNHKGGKTKYTPGRGKCLPKRAQKGVSIPPNWIFM